jgi:hypothetical protein
MGRVRVAGEGFVNRGAVGYFHKRCRQEGAMHAESGAQLAL